MPFFCATSFLVPWLNLWRVRSAQNFRYAFSFQCLPLLEESDAILCIRNYLNSQVKSIWIHCTLLEVQEKLQSTNICWNEMQNAIWKWRCFWKKVTVVQWSYMFFADGFPMHSGFSISLILMCSKSFLFRCTGIIIGSREAEPIWYGSKWKFLVVCSLLLICT